MTGVFLPDGSFRKLSAAAAPQVEWRRLAGREPYRVAVAEDPVRVVLTQRYVDEAGAVREQVQEFCGARELVFAIALNDYVAAVRGRIASELSDVAIALGVAEADLECLVEAISRQLHEGSDVVEAAFDPVADGGVP